MAPKQNPKLTPESPRWPPAKERALALAQALDDRAALDVRVLDLTQMGAFTDFFVIATATSDRHARTLANAAAEAVRAFGDDVLIEGERVGRWILVDSVDVVVHVFQTEAREYYALERLWGEAETLEVTLASGDAR